MSHSKVPDSKQKRIINQQLVRSLLIKLLNAIAIRY